MRVDRAPKKVPGATDIVKLACGAFHNLALNACAFLPLMPWRPPRLFSLGLHLHAPWLVPAPDKSLPVVPPPGVVVIRSCRSIILCLPGQGFGEPPACQGCRDVKENKLEGSYLAWHGRRAGEVLAWGINDFGQLGNGSTFYETEPTKVVSHSFNRSPIIDSHHCPSVLGPRLLAPCVAACRWAPAPLPDPSPRTCQHAGCTQRTSRVSSRVNENSTI